MAGGWRAGTKDWKCCGGGGGERGAGSGGAEDGDWKSFLMSAVAGLEGAAGGAERGGLPLTARWGGRAETGREPKVLTASGLRTGASAGDEEIGVGSSSMEPKETEPVAGEQRGMDRAGDVPGFIADTLARGMETPSLNGTLGRRECVGGAGDCEREDADDDCGGPRDQAERDDSAGFVGGAGEALLILTSREWPRKNIRS